MAVFELVQAKEPPAGLLMKFVAATGLFLHTVMLAGTLTVGTGLTVMVKEDEIPVQLFATGTTVMVAVIGLFPVFVAVNDGIFPVPLAPNPMAVFEFVQEKVPPAGILVKFTVGTVPLVQTVILAGTFTEGTGFTVMV